MTQTQTHRISKIAYKGTNISALLITDV